MSGEQVRSRCPECGRRGQWLDDQDHAYRDGLAHQISEHPRTVPLERRAGQR